MRKRTRPIPEPRSAVRVLGPVVIDAPDWHAVGEHESVRLVPIDAGDAPRAGAAPGAGDAPRAGAATVVTLPRAGYRWGAPASASAHLPAVRFERAVIALAARSEVLAGQVLRLEGRIDHLAERLFDAATQSDLIEIESRRARLAAEVARLSVELRSELDRGLSRLARQMAAIAATNQRTGTVDRLGPLDRADAARVELHLEHLATLDTVPEDLDLRSA